MKAILFTLLLAAFGLSAQAQNILNLDTLQFDGELDGIGVAKLDTDSLVSTFVIWVEDDVPLHRHNEHSETVVVLSGTGEMTIGEEVMTIGSGDYIFIPVGTPHAVTVTSDEPMKVLSVQAPEFDGTDREAIKE